MNLAVIGRLLRDGDMSLDAFRFLSRCNGECEWLDFKEELHLEDDKQLCDFTRDILAMKNVGGGYVLVGVRDKTWQPVGLVTRLPYDSKLLRDKVRKGAGVDLDVDIVHHSAQVLTAEKWFALIMVRSSRKKSKRHTPTLVTHDYCARKPFGLRRGDIYFRKGDSTVKVQSQLELDDLLDALDTQAEQDALNVVTQVSPFAIQDGTYRLLERGYDRFIGRRDLRVDVQKAVLRDPRIWIINVHGPGGVGKSALVNWVVYEFYRNRSFEAILHLTAKETILTPQGIVKASRSLYSLENLLSQIHDLFEEKLDANPEKNKNAAVEMLSAWSTLLVLDNLETVTDGRILNFAQNLPPHTKAKVLITSRQKTGAWELPVPVNELSLEEVREFLDVRTEEIGIQFPRDIETARKVWEASGGLPLAIQWILGRYRLVDSLLPAIEAVGKKDSPVLEFSFGNIWKVLSSDAKAILAVMTIFQEPPSISQIAVATEFDAERIEKALDQLAEVTLVTKSINQADGRARFVALPITLAFARNQLEMMGDFETRCRQRHNKFTDQMTLQQSELFKFQNRFERYGIETDSEKRAAILCQRGESEMFVGNTDNADMLFKQARELAPQSSYVFAMSASYEVARNRVGQAEQYANEACHRATKKTGSLCHIIKARILDIQHDRIGRVEALAKAVGFDPEDIVIRHQYGVALSRAGRSGDAVIQFDLIIEGEKKRALPQDALLIAIKTRMINLKRLNRMQEFARDLAYIDELLGKYPYLSDHNVDFDEFRTDTGPQGG